MERRTAVIGAGLVLVGGNYLLEATGNGQIDAGPEGITVQEDSRLASMVSSGSDAAPASDEPMTRDEWVGLLQAAPAPACPTEPEYRYELTFAPDPAAPAETTTTVEAPNNNQLCLDIAHTVLDAAQNSVTIPVVLNPASGKTVNMETTMKQTAPDDCVAMTDRLTAYAESAKGKANVTEEVTIVIKETSICGTEQPTA